MNGADATPDAFVVTVIVTVLLLKMPDAPVAGAVNVTLFPEIGLLRASLIVTERALVNAVLIVADCGVVPALAVMEAAAPTLFVSEKFTVVRLAEVAVTVYGPPAVEFAVIGADAMPEAFVATVMVAVVLLKIPDAPVAGAVNVTDTPESGLFEASLIVTASAFAKAVATVAACGVVPAFAVMEAAAPAVFVSEKFTVVRPADVAVTVYAPPAVEFAVNGADAMPEEFVATVMVAVLLLKIPDAPVPGAVNVTLTPEIGLLAASFTVTAGALAKAVETVADCGVVPALAVMLAGTCTTVTLSAGDIAAEASVV